MIITPIKFNNEFIDNEIYKITHFINWTIASETPIKYSGSQIDSNGSIIINSKNEKVFNFSGIETILNFWKNYDFKYAKTEIKRAYRNISEMYDINRIYTIKNTETNEFANIVFKKFNYEKVKLKELTFKDNSKISYLIDPYCKGYGIFQNISKLYKDYNLGYNYLHLYEHLMCMPWKKEAKDEDTIMMNGFTNDVGISIVYNVVATADKFRKNFKSIITHYYKSREQSYWKKHLEKLKLESMRTVSETFDERSLHDYFRSDPSVYHKGYNTDVFCYWSSRHFNALLVAPSEVELDFDLINILSKKYNKKIKRPIEETFDMIPIETLKKKIIYKYRIEKMDDNDFQKILTGKECNFIPGIDVKHSFNVDYKDKCSILYPLLFLRCKVNQQQLIRHLALPMNVSDYKDFRVNILKHLKG